DISKKPKKRLTWLVIVIVLILLISVGGYFSYPYLTSLFQGKTPPSPALFTEEETKSPDILPEGTTVFEEESDVIDTIPEEIEIVLQEEQEPVQEKEVKTTIQSSQDSYSHVNFVKGNFYVIAGSFVTEKSAIQHISQHRLQKHNPVLLYQKGNNRVRVCIGTFSTEEEAQRFADQFNRNYWVLH
ncbi:SPOR domain-containing protein, partial [Bacteroidales bacterium OttesenSCG-928-L19]|nr:SPOR domain-containing protein [Bacteroidales bacterium OttesenSCG-928-L19]